METPYYAITLDENGHMVSIFDKKHDRELVQAGKAANQLRLYEDKPIYFDNWDIDMCFGYFLWYSIWVFMVLYLQTLYSPL